MGDMQGVATAEWRGSLPENMEPAAAFVQRADKWWKDNVLRHYCRLTQHGHGAHGSAEQPGKNILVVSHGGLMHVLLQNLIESRRVKVGTGVDVGQYRLSNASVTVIEVERDGKGTLVLFGDTTHLEDELVEGNADDVAA